MGKGRTYRYNRGRTPLQERLGTPCEPVVRSFRRLFTVRPFEYAEVSAAPPAFRGFVRAVNNAAAWVRRVKHREKQGKYRDRIREREARAATSVGRSARREGQA